VLNYNTIRKQIGNEEISTKKILFRELVFGENKSRKAYENGL